MAIIVFTRLIGIALCGEPRTAAASTAHEAGLRMQASMGLLFLLCFTGGLAPVLLLTPIALVVPGLDPLLAAALPAAYAAPMWIGRTGALLVALLLLLIFISRRLTAHNTPATAPTWGCGFSFPTPRMAYSAEGYADLAATSLMPESLQPSATGGRAVTFFPGPALLGLATADPFLKQLCEPLFTKFAVSCSRLRRLQSGNLYLYILYIFVTTGLLLVWTALRSG
ncbi:MAG: hypothetical protein A2511_09830 [Deltaproteobacteria bacterium RIFOXYD12_FULL_50_9]|nr:MAG: hypothetical protein A2511_09830 [Deltaproteobacteria bacterium RIFOXYD12_FULL_50_9]